MIIAGTLDVNTAFEHLNSTPFHIYKQLCRVVYRSFAIELPRSHYYDLFFTNQTFNTTKAREELGHVCNMPLRDGFRRLLEWYREMGYLGAISPESAR